MNGIKTFSILQLGDMLTTLVFLSMGVIEANPLVRYAMETTSPVVGLIAVKLLAVILGVFCLRTGRSFFKINLFFALIVMWNLVAIFLTI